jgi:hypothetical protein
MRMRSSDVTGLVLEMINSYKIFVRKQKGRDHLEDLGFDGSAVLNSLRNYSIRLLIY